MSYEFKKLSEVTALEEMKEGLNVLVEDGGEIVKVAADKVGGSGGSGGGSGGMVVSLEEVFIWDDAHPENDEHYVTADKTFVDVYDALMNSEIRPQFKLNGMLMDIVNNDPREPRTLTAVGCNFNDGYFDTGPMAWALC